MVHAVPSPPVSVGFSRLATSMVLLVRLAMDVIAVTDIPKSPVPLEEHGDQPDSRPVMPAPCFKRIASRSDIF
jgi:hypothetical protein